MRRIAAVVLATGVAFASVGAMAADANAAAKGKWATKNGWKSIKADGTYAKNKTKVVVNGYLRDTVRNGYAPGVQFLAKEKGKKDHYSPIYYFTENGVPKDRYFNLKAPKNFFKSYNTGHLYVREAAIKRTNSKKITFAPWKKVY